MTDFVRVLAVNHGDVPNHFNLAGCFGNAWAVYRGKESYDVKIGFRKDMAPLVVKTDG